MILTVIKYHHAINHKFFFIVGIRPVAFVILIKEILLIASGAMPLTACWCIGNYVHVSAAAADWISCSDYWCLNSILIGLVKYNVRKFIQM